MNLEGFEYHCRYCDHKWFSYISKRKCPRCGESLSSTTSGGSPVGGCTGGSSGPSISSSSITPIPFQIKMRKIQKYKWRREQYGK
jgi:hypothetical protein